MFKQVKKINYQNYRFIEKKLIKDSTQIPQHSFIFLKNDIRVIVNENTDSFFFYQILPTGVLAPTPLSWPEEWVEWSEKDFEFLKKWHH